MKQLDIVVPGLLGPFSSDVPVHIHEQLLQPEYKLINKCLSRAVISEKKASSYYEVLASLIGVTPGLSLCQLTAQHDAVDLSQGFYYRADPVHFKAESDHAILLGPQIILPLLNEAEQLIEVFNQHFEEDRISLHLGSEHRWYIKCERKLNLQFNSLDDSLGRDIKHFMPEGEDALWWRRIVNEAQMLFFQHGVNQRREECSQLPINGLWLWDFALEVGQLEQCKNKAKQLHSDEAVAIAMANQARLSVSSELDMDGLDADSILVINNLYESVCYGDMDAWLEELKLFCDGLFSQIIDKLKSRIFDTVNIYPCDGRVFKITSTQLLKFWKSVKTADQFFIKPVS